MALQDDREFLSQNLLDAVVPSRKIINQTILMLKPNGIIKNLEAPYNEIKKLFKKQFENSCFLDGRIIAESVPEYNAFAPHFNNLIFLINIALASYMLFSQTALDHVLNSLFTAVVPETTEINDHICAAYAELLYLVAKDQIENSNDDWEALLKSLKPPIPDRMAQYDERINQHASSCLEYLSNGAPAKSQEDFILIWQKALVGIIKQSRPIRDILISVPKQLTEAVGSSKEKHVNGSSAQKVNGSHGSVSPTMDAPPPSTTNGINTESIDTANENNTGSRQMDVDNHEQIDTMNSGTAVSESQNNIEKEKDNSAIVVVDPTIDDTEEQDRSINNEKVEENSNDLTTTRSSTEAISIEQHSNNEETEQLSVRDSSAGTCNGSSKDSFDNRIGKENDTAVVDDQSLSKEASLDRERVEETEDMEVDDRSLSREVSFNRGRVEDMELDESEEDVFVDASEDFFEEEDDNNTEEVFVDAPTSPKTLSDASTPLSRASTPSAAAAATNSPSSQPMPVPVLHPSNERGALTLSTTVSPSPPPSAVMTPPTPPAVQIAPPPAAVQPQTQSQLQLQPQPQPQPQQPERKRTVAEVMASGQPNPFMSNRNRYHTTLLDAGTQERKRRKRMW